MLLWVPNEAAMLRRRHDFKRRGFFVCLKRFWYCLCKSTVQHRCPKFYEELASISLEGAQHFSIQTCFLIDNVFPTRQALGALRAVRHMSKALGTTTLSFSNSDLKRLQLLSSRNVCLVSHSLFAQNTFHFSIQQYSFMSSVHILCIQICVCVF